MVTAMSHSSSISRVGTSSVAVAALVGALFGAGVLPQARAAENPIVVENALPGSPQSEWDVAAAGDPSIQGFATDISVNRGSTVDFKIDTGVGGQPRVAEPVRPAPRGRRRPPPVPPQRTRCPRELGAAGTAISDSLGDLTAGPAARP